jgi:hypothetical protein
MARPRLTVLTTPVAGGTRDAYQRLRSLVRPLVKPNVPLPEMSPYPGHFALVRSVVEGLRGINADFNFNPRRFGDVGEVVYAPANEALRQAAALKRNGRIRCLAAGPTNAFHPDECGAILRLPEIDRLIVASPWVLDLYRELAPALAAKMRVCPTGVDAEYWQPSGHAPARAAVLYRKVADAGFSAAVADRLGAAGFFVRQIDYGKYGRDDLRAALDGASVAVFLSPFETQGLALAEAWSMNVPTLAWDPRAAAEWRGFQFRAGSSAPYLTVETGRRWRTLDELAALLAAPPVTQARAWVLEHMTDVVCARRLYDLLLTPASDRE